MFKITKLQGLVGALAATVLLGGCKSETNYVDNVQLNGNTVSFEYVTVFSKNLEADIEGSFAVGKHGTIQFFNDDQNRLNIKLLADFTLFKDNALTKVETLPNGSPFPSIVNGTSMNQLLVRQDKNANLFAYVNDWNGSPASKKLVGLAVQFVKVDNNFPKVAITQNFFNKNGRKFASVTFFGPNEVNGTTLPGGFALLGDIDAAFKAQAVRVNYAIVGKDAHKYKTPEEREELFKQLKSGMAREGIYLK